MLVLGYWYRGKRLHYFYLIKITTKFFIVICRHLSVMTTACLHHFFAALFKDGMRMLGGGS